MLPSRALFLKQTNELLISAIQLEKAENILVDEQTESMKTKAKISRAQRARRRSNNK